MNIIHICHYTHIIFIMHKICIINIIFLYMQTILHIIYIYNTILSILNYITDMFTIKAVQTLLYIFYILKVSNR